MAALWHRIGLVVPLCVAWMGCTSPLDLSKGRAASPLQPAQMSSDAVVLEVFFARFPLGDPEVNGGLWREIDEQPFGTQNRHALERNGFRAGVVGGQVPLALSQLLEMKDEAPSADGVSRLSVEQMRADPRVVHRRMSLRPACRSEVVASRMYDEMTVLRCEAGGLCGRTYQKALGLFALTAFPRHDGRVEIELVPEVHHGDPARRWVGDQGVFRLDTGRDKQAFTDLAVTATLAPGEMLALTCLPGRDGSLGHYFFTDASSGDPQQKLLLVRVAQTQHDGLFSSGDVLPLDNIDK